MAFLPKLPQMALKQGRKAISFYSLSNLPITKALNTSLIYKHLELHNSFFKAQNRAKI